jgi:hypothetical protein
LLTPFIGPTKYFFEGDALRAYVVSTADEYRGYADECFGWAKSAKTEREREIFIQMAETWLRAAVVASGRELPDPSIRKSPRDGDGNAAA